MVSVKPRLRFSFLYVFLVSKGNHYRYSLDVSNTDISKYLLTSKSIVLTNFLFLLYFCSCNLILLISQISVDQEIYFAISVVWDELWLWDIERLLYSFSTGMTIELAEQYCFQNLAFLSIHNFPGQTHQLWFPNCNVEYRNTHLPHYIG